MQVTMSPQQVRRRSEQVRTPGPVFPDVRHLVVARRDRLGDFVLTLPALAALRETYPRARLAALVDPRVAPLARLVPGLDEVWEAPDEAAELRRRLADAGTDLLVSISRDPATAWAAWRAAVPQRLGTARRAYASLFNRKVDEPRRGGDLHEVEYALSFAHRAGAAARPARFPLRVAPADRVGAASFLAGIGVGGPFVVVHPGSGGSCPRWPAGHFGELVALLRRDGVDVVLSLGPGDSDIDSARGGVAVATFEGPLPRLAALLASASLVVGNSTGPLHLAAALGTPTLQLHAPWTSCAVGRFGPYSDLGWGLVADHAAARGWSRTERQRHGAELMAGLAPAAVRDAVTTLLAGRRLDA